MEIIVIGDIHNDVENIIALSDKIALLNFDVIVCPGDFTDVPPRGFSREDIAMLIIQELKSFKKPLVAVPGNFDKEVIKILDEEDSNIHGKGKIIGDVGFYGYGGAKTPFNTPLEPNNEELQSGLEGGYNEIKKAKYKVQVTHTPPARTKLDLLYTGAHVGSEVVRKFIETKQPHVAVSAHIHEARGVDELGKTKLINAGRFPEGYCGLISIKNGSVKVKVICLI
jgi:hypothetical protein